jgi:hypothetical protein
MIISAKNAENKSVNHRIERNAAIAPHVDGWIVGIAATKDHFRNP